MNALLNSFNLQPLRPSPSSSSHKSCLELECLLACVDGMDWSKADTSSWMIDSDVQMLYM